MRKLTLKAALAAMIASVFATSAAVQAREPFIGEIMQFGADFCPRGWAKTEGQLLPIAQNSALFSLLGTIYGGDGRNTFALPDFRGRVAIAPGTGPGLSAYRLGERGGREYNTSRQVSTMDGSDDVATRSDLEETNRQPFLAITTCIALQGIYPSRR